MAQTAAAAPFRRFLDSQSPFLNNIEHENAVTHADNALKRLPPIRGLLETWQKLSQEPFKGITTDGVIRRDLFARADDGIPSEDIKRTGDDLIAAMTDDQRKAATMPFDVPERRIWQNTHLYMHAYRLGIRLEDVSDQVRALVLELLETSMSPEGYQKAILATETNAFLGRLYNGSGVLNQYSYNFVLFGKPSISEPWGWTFFGHHLCLCFFIYGQHIEISPTFMGAEPNVIDDGPLVELYVPEQETGLSFMRGLPPESQALARIRETMDPPAGSEGTHTWAVGGAFQDNRVVPPQGVCLGHVSLELQKVLLETIEQFVLYLPWKARRRKLDTAAKFMAETWFCWIGGFGEQDAFYYRIQSPVIICEFEHCPSIFLGNTKPERFHVHTHVRTPNAGDYGYALLD